MEKSINFKYRYLIICLLVISCSKSSFRFDNTPSSSYVEYYYLKENIIFSQTARHMTTRDTAFLTIYKPDSMNSIYTLKYKDSSTVIYNNIEESDDFKVFKLLDTTESLQKKRGRVSHRLGIESKLITLDIGTDSLLVTTYLQTIREIPVTCFVRWGNDSFSYSEKLRARIIVKNGELLFPIEEKYKDKLYYR